MILAEPPPSQGDVHFRLFGIPVRVHPFFWLVTLIIALRGDSSPPAEVFSWVIAVFVSILIHELGHAFLQRRYGGHPSIVLHGMGGLAICGDCDRSSRSQVLISLAGPAAGFLFAVLILVLGRISGHGAGLAWGYQELAEPVIDQHILGFTFYWERFSSYHVNLMIWNLLWINIMWGAINLLPIYPLDGGQISRELCQSWHPREGIVLSLRTSMIAAIGMAIVGLSWQSLLVVIMFGYLAYSSYKTLEAYRAQLW